MISNSPFAVQYLAKAVLVFLATRRRHNGRKWTRKGIAEYITGSEDIEGVLSDTTLGRFLSTDRQQEPSDETVRMVAAFLVYQRALTNSQLEWLSEPIAVSAGLSLAQFLEIPSTNTQREFLKSLEGPYVSIRHSDPFLLHSRIVLTYLDKVELLLACENICLYRTPGIDLLTDGSVGAALRGLQAEAALLKKLADRKVFESVSSGQVIANADILWIFLKADKRGFHSLLHASALTYDEEDNVIALHCKRNAGWKALASNDLNLPGLVTSRMDPRSVARILGEDARFTHVLPATETAEVDAGPDDVDNVRTKSFVEIVFSRGIVDDPIFDEALKKIESPNERLLFSLTYGRLDKFIEALNDGADPNFVFPEDGSPLIVSFAKNGRLEWAQALLATGRCRLSADDNGVWPSIYPGAIVRQIVGTSGVSDLVSRLTQLHDMLQAEEIRQMLNTSNPERAPEI